VGTHTDANTKCTAGDGLGEWSTTRPALWSQDGQRTIASLPFAPHAAYRRSELQAIYAKVGEEIEKLNQRVEEQACERAGARLLMTHPEVGPITSLATEVFLGDAARFADIGLLLAQNLHGFHTRRANCRYQRSHCRDGKHNQNYA
jgi:transposase